MGLMQRWLRTLAMALSLLIGGVFAMPEIAFAGADTASMDDGECKKRKRKKRRAKKRKKRRAKKRRAKKRSKKRRAKKRRARKITSKRIIGWWNAGYSEREIVAKLDKAGYVPTALAIKRLRTAFVAPTLVSKIEQRAPFDVDEIDSAPARSVAEAAPVAEPVARNARVVKVAPVAKADAVAPEEQPPIRPIKLEVLRSDADIDFDDVPAPTGMPAAVVKAPAKKKLDRSLRPSAPFQEDDSSAQQPQRRRRVIVPTE